MRPPDCESAACHESDIIQMFTYMSYLARSYGSGGKEIS